MFRRWWAALVAPWLLVVVACSSSDAQSLRLGYFPNVTHATALVGLEQVLFAKELEAAGQGLAPSSFNAGPAAIEALLSGALDASYIGPNPTLNAHVRSKGAALRVVAGATSGGAFFVVAPTIASAEDLRGKTVASPQLGGTQDVALRKWLAEQGLKTDPQGGGDVSIAPQENAQILESFVAGTIAGAWVPEPWATRLVVEGKGKVLVDEGTLWPEGRYVTTHLVVRAELLRDRPAEVEALLRAHVAATQWIAEHPAEAQAAVIAGIERATGKKIAADIVAQAWPHLEFTHDPIASSLHRSAADAEAVGLLALEGADLDALYDLAPLQRVLAARGVPAAQAKVAP
jgi:NitT/TauT family transport system substrate-binding protein